MAGAGDSKLKQPVPTETPSWPPPLCRKYTQNTNPNDTNIFVSNINVSQREKRAQINVVPEGRGCAPTCENSLVGLNSP